SERLRRETRQEKEPHREKEKERRQEQEPHKERPRRERYEKEPHVEKGEQRYKEEKPHTERRERKYKEEYCEERRGRRYNELPRQDHRHVDDHWRAPMHSLKCWIPPFVRKGDVKMVAYKFCGYTLEWWDQYSKDVREGRIRHIDTWLNLK
ncbi:hypothetical protein CR513_26243, partial [Mucuna pruriens]